MHDEAEIRGHRRTYIGALPGQIIQGIRRAETNDPVFMLDEIDKLGRDFRGDPASALLETLIRSRTTRSATTISMCRSICRRCCSSARRTCSIRSRTAAGPHGDYRLQGYTEEEKVHIAYQYLVPRQIEENGITAEQIEFPEEGVRLHHPALHARSRRPQAGRTDRHGLPQAGAPHRGREDRQAGGHAGLMQRDSWAASRSASKAKSPSGRSEPGVVVGLAWTPAGGDMLFIEANKMKGKGGFTITGQIRPVMQESMQAALTLGTFERAAAWASTRTSSRSTISTFTCRRERFRRMVLRLA